MIFFNFLLQKAYPLIVKAQKSRLILPYVGDIENKQESFKLQQDLQKSKVLVYKNENFVRLTRRQLVIAMSYVRNFSTKEIAREYHISHRTVEKHIENVYSKLGINSKRELSICLNLIPMTHLNGD